MEYNRNSPTTSGGNTPPIPTGSEGNFAGMNPQMAGMNPQTAGMNPQMAGMAGMGGMPAMTPQMWYNFYNWMSQMGPTGMAGMGGMPPNMSGMGGMPPNMSGMGGVMPGAVGMGGMPQNMSGMGGVMHGAVGMGGTPQNMSVGGVMPGAVGMGGTPQNMSVGGSMQHRSPRTPRESVYRPYIDYDSPSTVPETQFGAFESFSLEELGVQLGLSPVRHTPDQAEPAARDRSKGKAKSKGKSKAGGSSGARGKNKVPSVSSHTGVDGEEEEEEGEDETGRRTVWTIWENAALAKAWRGVVEDPYVGPNQYLDRLWHRVSDAYSEVKPPAFKDRNPEQCRKQWMRLRPKLSRFAALYQNNMRMVTSGMSEDDVKNRALAQYPDRELKFREFDQWEAYLVVRDSPKFAAGVEAGWKRTKINSSGEYSSSAGSHELPEAEEVAPLPRTDSRRRRRPMGQQAAQRLARGIGSGSGSGSGPIEVESEAPGDPASAALATAQLTKTLMQTTLRWYNAQDPVLKRLCKQLVDQCRRKLGMLPIDDDGVEIGGGDVGGGSGTGDGDEDEDEEDE